MTGLIRGTGTGPHRLAARTRARRDQAGARLAPIGIAIGGMLFLALVVSGGIFLAGWHYLHFLPFRREPLSAETLYDLLKVAFAFAAGIAGIVALVTAYRRQRVAEFAEQRESTRLFNERFATAAGQLGDDKPAIRLAGVYAMAQLADDWAEQRQTCVDVLCAYLRMPYEPEPGHDAPAAERQVFRAGREVRHTVIRIIASRLRASRAPTLADWRGLNLDFTGAVFDGAEFLGAEFAGEVNFTDAEFASGEVHFSGAKFASGDVSFTDAKFTGATVNFARAEFAGEVSFYLAEFTSGTVSFDGAKFASGEVSFTDAKFTGATVNFSGAKITGGEISFYLAEFTSGTVNFSGADFTSGEVHFGAKFTGGEVSFTYADFTGANVSFYRAEFTGATVNFSGAKITGGEIDFTGAAGALPLFPG